MISIKEVLEEKGLRHNWLSKRLGKTYAIVNAYLQSPKQPRFDVLCEIASMLKIAPKYLINSNIK